MTTTRQLEGRRVLVLEDNFLLAREEKALLEQEGAKVVGPFATAFRLDKLASLREIDSAVVDINLGHGPVFDFAYLLRERGVPFVFVTGYDAATIPNDLSYVEGVEKPIRATEFVEAIERLPYVNRDREIG